jgi:hypothetical protein
MNGVKFHNEKHSLDTLLMDIINLLALAGIHVFR